VFDGNPEKELTESATLAQHEDVRNKAFDICGKMFEQQDKMKFHHQVTSFLSLVLEEKQLETRCLQEIEECTLRLRNEAKKEAK
jgi:hypothetical protein